MPFTVAPEIPKNQATDAGDFFNLVMSPNEKQTIKVDLTNSTDNAVTVDCAVASATTNLNGVIEYSPNKIKPDSSLIYNLKDYVSLPSKVSLPARTTEAVSVVVTMPQNASSGIMAGGLTFKQDPSEIKAPKAQKGISINNEYQFVVGLFIQQNTAAVAPSLTLNTVAPGQVNLRNVINANLQNSEMGFLKQMNVDATIKGISDTSLAYSYQNQKMAMAPNSNFDLPIPVSTGSGPSEYSKPMQAGKYHLHMVVYGQKDVNGKYSTMVAGQKQGYDYRWIFDRDFTITAKQATDLNAKDVTVDHSTVNWLLIIGLVLLALVLIIFFIIFWKRTHEKYEEDVYDVDGNLLHEKGERVVRGEKVYRFDELALEVKSKILERQISAERRLKEEEVK